MKLSYHVLRILFISVAVATFSCKPQIQIKEYPKPTNSFKNVKELLADETKLISAHRGGMVYPGYPENSLETFIYMDRMVPNVIIECDIEMTKDSVLIMLHDNTLERTTTGTGNIRSKTWDEIKDLRLKDNFGTLTEFRIPLLEDVLKWSSGTAILSLDTKRGVPFNRIIREVERLDCVQNVIMITYSTENIIDIHELNSTLMLSVTMRNFAEVERVLTTGVPAENMVAFTGTIRSDKKLYEKIHSLGIKCIFGTFGNIDNMAKARGPRIYSELILNGVDIIATDRPIEANSAVLEMIQE